jgi:4-hydroxybenzoyl-CoA reductase subunit alpha
MGEYSIIGKRVPRVDGILKVTGRAEFTDDISLPRMLYGKILRSPYPHAKILNVDKSRAENLPGVKAVITCRDIGEIRYGRRGFKDKYILALDRVRYVGDEVAAIAAIDEDTAEEALELIRVDYEPLPAVFDPEEAMRNDAPRIHDHVERNICGKTEFEIGNLNAGFKESDYIREDMFFTQATNHAAIELHAIIADFDPSGKLKIWGATQSPFTWSVQLSQTLRIPESDIRVVNPYVGGGFGGKVDMMSYGFCAVLLSKIVERPVKIVLNREEVFSATRQRHPMKIYLKTGVKKDGTLIATECRLIADGGAYAPAGIITIYLSGAFLSSVYRIPNLKYEGYRIYTNNPIRFAQRGHGNPQPRFAFESQLDTIAEELNIDPLYIRNKNSIQKGDRILGDMEIKSCALKECIERSGEEIGWKDKKGKLPKGKGIGIGCSSFVSGVLVPPYSYSGAIIKVNVDGRVTLLTGITDVGQGSDTIMSQIVADELGVSFKDVKIISGDTGVTPAHPGSFSNRGTLWAGNAVRYAALDVKKQIFERVADRLEANIEDLEAKDGWIYVKGSTDRGISFKDAIRTIFLAKEGRPIMGRGYYRPDIDLVNFETGEGKITPAYSFDAQTSEVDVDLETGVVKILNIISANDCGIPINPMAIEGQVEGAISMGEGQVLFEELIWDKGYILNPSFLGYRIPTSLDIPDMKTVIIESKDETLPLGAKTSEGTVVSVIPSIANALYNATGVRIKKLPITPESILKELEKKIKDVK